MRCQLLFLVLLRVGTALAQRPVVTDSRSTGPHGEQYVGPFSLKYRGGYIIARPAYLYRRLADVPRGQYAYRLHVGDHVFTNQQFSPRTRWLRVARYTYEKGTTPKYDTARYYLRASALLDQQGTLSSFTTQ